MRRLLRVLALLPVWLVLLLLIAWGGGALWIDGPVSRPLAGGLAVTFVLASLAILVFVRPFWRAVPVFLVLFVLLYAWWDHIPARNDRAWQPDVAKLPYATFDGDRVTVHNVRNFDYRTEYDYTPRWEERTFDLSKLEGSDLFLSFWGIPGIAHTIMSWDFSDGQHLAVSIETRKEPGESYSTLRGFFRQYELYYVVADERDVVRLRTNYRDPHEQVYLYRLRPRPDRGRAVLLQYLHEVNRLAERAAWYNALTHNCTTTIRLNVIAAGVNMPLDWRLVANGHLPEFLYENGVIDTGMPLAELTAKSLINERAEAADHDPEFSARIRGGLPPRPAPHG
jgi:hypothetical protein